MAKVRQRKHVWKKIYGKAGLPPDVSNYCGNYKKKEKLVGQLMALEVNKQKAEKI